MLHVAPADRLPLTWTPAVLCWVFCLGVWADPIDLFGLPAGWLTRCTFAVAAATTAASIVDPATRIRLVAMLAGAAATVSRGITIIVIGQAGVPRKSELIGGSVWLGFAWMVVALWVLSVPAERRRAGR